MLCWSIVDEALFESMASYRLYKNVSLMHRFLTWCLSWCVLVFSFGLVCLMNCIVRCWWLFCFSIGDEELVESMASYRLHKCFFDASLSHLMFELMCVCFFVFRISLFELYRSMLMFGLFFDWGWRALRKYDDLPFI